ncbi:hypothetical protein HAX54_030104 [Datura stramonium]|uniref:Uncharacterized protein n=1 Tax=Datura stramonium TaxID=4076 RepID=A0ABS8V9H1_DATST|nr:hypothetical protein [Datura stramonium]
MIYKGIYHLFYQYNRRSAVWGDIVWGHSTSTDLVNWTLHPPALFPSEPYDTKGCWSGSATILQDEWVKSPHNPIMTPNAMSRTLFRDPSTAWLEPDGSWRVIIGNEREHHGTALLYRSKDFNHWIEAEQPLHSSNETGIDKNRRIFIAWINESTSRDIDIMKGWSGLQPVEEINNLRTNNVKLPTTTLKEEGSALEVSGVTGAQADVEISFSIPMLEKAEMLESRWTNPQEICSQRGSSAKGGVGPFGLLVLASNDIQEFTVVFLRMFRKNDKFIVLMCTDLKRCMFKSR